MRVIVAGSRGITDYEAVKRAIENSGFEVTTVVSGNARGVDRLGERYASENELPIDTYLPDWQQHGNFAGILRNQQMVRNADALVAVWDGVSRGTKHVIHHARDHGLQVHVERVS